MQRKPEENKKSLWKIVRKPTAYSIYPPPCMREGGPLLIEVALQKGPLPPSPSLYAPPPRPIGTPPMLIVNPSSWGLG